MLWFVTRERVKQSLDSKETAANNAQVDRAIEGACRSIEGELGRRFAPLVATFRFRSPPGGGAVSAFGLTLGLPDHEAHLYVDRELDVDLIEVDSIEVDGTVVDPARYTLLPLDGPPYNEIEFAGVSLGLATGRPIEIAGLWGYDNVTGPAGALAAAVGTTTTTTVDVTDSSTTGVGSLLTVGTERMTVMQRGQLDTGQGLATALAANMAARVVEVQDGDQIHAGEVLLVDEERMLVTDVAGDDVIVRRAWDGSVVAAHNQAADVYALRRLTVERGVLGTTAATHSLAAAVRVQVYPGPVVSYATSLAQSLLLQEVTGQQQAPGGHTFGTTIDADRARAVAACGRDAGFA